MRFLRFVGISFWVVVLIGYSLPQASAKGTVHRILISGGDLEGEIAVNELGMTSLLSMAGFEDFLGGEVEPPANLGTGYELQRQYKHGQNYQTFDRVVYYPDPLGERGYVYYTGIENGWSEYDEKWYRVFPEGDMAMQRILANARLKPTIVAVTGTGEIYLLDAMTLEQISTTSLYNQKTGQDEWAYVTSIGASADGQKLLVNTTNSYADMAYLLNITETSTSCPTQIGQYLMTGLDNSIITHSLAEVQIRESTNLEITESVSTENVGTLIPASNGLAAMGVAVENDRIVLTPFNTLEGAFGKATTLENLENAHGYGGVWELSFGQFYLTNGEHLIMWDQWSNDVTGEKNNLNLPNVDTLQEAGVTIVPITARDGRIFLYPQLGKYWLYDDTLSVRGGIYVVNVWENTTPGQWHPDLHFSQVIEGGEMLYALQATHESTQLFMLDITNGGKIVTSAALPDDVVSIGYVRLEDFESKTITACAVVESAA